MRKRAGPFDPPDNPWHRLCSRLRITRTMVSLIGASILTQTLSSPIGQYMSSTSVPCVGSGVSVDMSNHQWRTPSRSGKSVPVADLTGDSQDDVDVGYVVVYQVFRFNETGYLDNLAVDGDFLGGSTRYLRVCRCNR